MILRYKLISVSKPTTLVSVSTVNPHSSNNKHLREKAYRPQSDKMQRLDPKTSTDLIGTFLFLAVKMFSEQKEKNIVTEQCAIGEFSWKKSV